ncbi:MAG TPA: LemA family protein, partial [Rubrobacter sp.]|nr:LemA family protein [Rubrobacter sp.]
MLWWLLVGAGVLALVACTLLYNRLVMLRNRVDNAWSQVDVQLRQRYDLIPNLVATVKGYAAHESETFRAVVAARDGARSAVTIEEQGRAETRGAWLQRLQPLFGLLLVALSVAAVAFVYLRYGGEPKVEYSGRYEREPPTDDPPAVISAIISQKPSVGTREFTATLFDLIRRGVLKAQPVSVKKGGLLGEKTVTDLRVELGSYETGTLEVFERRVLNLAARVLSRGPVNLTDFEERIKDDREANRSSYESFTDDLKRDVEGRDLVEKSPGRWLGPAAVLVGLVGAVWFVLSLLGVNVVSLVSLIFSSFFSIIVAGFIVWVTYRVVSRFAGSALHRMWVRRTPKGALLHARWRAFRRYLTDV